MDLNKKPWPLATINGIRSRIDTNPDYQRPAVWSISQKRLLIDTILRGYDIPKIYWRKTGKSPDTYEVIDGQQRLRAIWDFMANEIDLGKDAEPMNGNELKHATYSGKNMLPDDLRLGFDTYSLDVIVMTDTDDEEVREMFLRLQNGTSLKAQEKRNARTGNMREFVKQLSSHKFFENCNFDNFRYTYDLIAAQMIKLELSGGPCNVKNADLNKMYEEGKTFDVTSNKAKKVKRVLEFLLKAFPEKTPELERYSTVSLYLLVSHMMERYVMYDFNDDLREWFINFESYKRKERRKDADHCDPEIIAYHEKTSHSTDAQDSIEWRHKYLLKKYFEHNQKLVLKDNVRIFSEEQRVTIFRKDDGICKVKKMCSGIKCEWDAWEADHIVPWSRGGKTAVENGQVACSACNASKGKSVSA